MIHPASAVAIVLGSVVYLGTTYPSAQQSPSVDVPIATLLDWYAEGRVTVGRTPATIANATQLARALERGGENWIDRAEPAARARRRLVASTLALELARSLPGLDRAAAVRRLTIWGANLHRSAGESDPGERLWAMASIAVLEDCDDWIFLSGTERRGKPVAATGRVDLQTVLDHGYLPHLRARFPNEPRIALASAVAIENSTWMIGSFGRPAGTGGGLISGEMTEDYLSALERGDLVMADGSRWTGGEARRAGRLHLARVDELRSLAQSLDELTRVETVAGEAHLRLGLLNFRLADRITALDHLSRARDMTRDPSLIYLSHFFSALIHERSGRDDAAVDAYRSALRTAPGAQSGTVRLSTLFVRLGRNEEAGAVAEEFFRANSAQDPWSDYRRGDARLWDDLRAQLREAWR